MNKLCPLKRERKSFENTSSPLKILRILIASHKKTEAQKNNHLNRAYTLSLKHRTQICVPLLTIRFDIVLPLLFDIKYYLHSVSFYDFYRGLL